MVGPISSAASRINANFSCCCSGTKLVSVTVRDTSGRRSIFAAKASASARDGCKIAIVFGAVMRVFHQIVECRNGFDLGAAQIDRVEIEFEAAEKRQPGGDTNRRNRQNEAAMARHEPINRSQHAIADVARFAGRFQQHQKRRQKA